ncbi:MAG TPA: MmgE/PrpD family protein [Acidimicrobiales bacterium]|nr:MmgE/PrpD family protein [Acidimicrobiales bacterium]
MTYEPISFTAEVAARAAGLRFEDLPDPVVEVARQCLLDWLGVTVAGSTDETARLMTAELADLAGRTGEDTTPAGEGAIGSSVVGRRLRLAPHDAALVNGTASHALDYDDVNDAMIGHPSVPLWPAVLALGEWLGCDGPTLITAFVAGYETECRIGRALGTEHYQRGFHATGTAGTFGAAAACSRLLGSDPATTAVALGLAATQAAGLKSMFGTMAKPLHAGRAASAGLVAARLAARGFTAHPAAVECEQGFAPTHSESYDPERGLSDPEGGWHVLRNLFKYHAACFQTHSSIEGLLRLRTTHGFGPDDAARVVVHADDMQMRMCAIPEPATGLEVKFSLRHTAAMALAGVDTSAPASFTEAVANDPALVALRRRVEVVVDRRPGSATAVDVELRDGRSLSAAHDVSVPESDLAQQRRRLTDKFHALVDPVLGRPAAEALADACARLPEGDAATLAGMGVPALVTAAGR